MSYQNLRAWTVLYFAISNIVISARVLAVPNLVQSMKEKRADFSLVTASDGLIYAIGGEKKSPSMEALDIETMTWKKMPTPISLRYGAGAVEVNGEIIVMGGTTDFDHSYYHPGGEKYLSQIWSYNIQEKSWSTLAKMNFLRTNIALAKIGETVFVTGGSGLHKFNGETFLITDPRYSSDNFIDAHGIRLAESFETIAGLSSVIPAMRFRRSQHALVLGPDQKLYAFGGNFEGDLYGYPVHTVSFGSWYLNRIVESYDPSSQVWTTVARMRTPRVGLAAVTAKDGKIYTIGGSTRALGIGGITNLVEVFDTQTRKWEVKSPMPTARWRHAAALGKDGRIYVAGGVSEKQSVINIVEIYDPITDKWETSSTPSPEDRLNFNTLQLLFNSPEATAPTTMAELIAWRSGRCFRYDAPEIPLPALLVGYESSGVVKSYNFHHDLPAPEYFDEISEKTRSEVNLAIERVDPFLTTSESNSGTFLTSILAYESNGKKRVLEQRFKQTRDYFIVQTLVPAKSSRAESTEDFCYHKRNGSVEGY